MLYNYAPDSDWLFELYNEDPAASRSRELAKAIARDPNSPRATSAMGELRNHQFDTLSRLAAAGGYSAPQRTEYTQQQMLDLLGRSGGRGPSYGYYQ
jgi:hypothetical protein